jgi:hypothetical protein
MLLVQQFLQNHTFRELKEKHGVYASFSKSGHKFSLNYDQIEAKESDPLAQECRGLILAFEDCRTLQSEVNSYSFDNIIPGKTKILAYPMQRFFNYGQECAANINWSDPKLSVMEKLDGSLTIVYWDSCINKWCVATRSVPEADILMDNKIYTFRTLFEKSLYDTCGLSFDEYTSKLNRKITYCFELTTPYNRIVVEYKTNRVTLLAARDISYLSELDIYDIDTYGVPIVQKYSINSISDIINFVSSLNPLEHEGVVIKDSNFNRIKVKNAQYVTYSKIKDLCVSPRNCLEIILLNRDDDVMPFLSEEIAKQLLDIKNKLKHLINKYDALYLSIKEKADSIEKGDRKTFALLLKDQNNLWSAPFFQIFDNKVLNFYDFIIKNKNNDDSWSNSFLDKILELL